MTKRMSAREEKAKQHKAALDEIEKKRKELTHKPPKRDRAARVEDSHDDMAAMSIQMAYYNKNAKDMAERRLALDERKEAREEAKEERLEGERLERQTSTADQSQSGSFDAIATRFDRLENMLLSAIDDKKTEEVKEESGAKEEIHQLN